MALKYAQGKFEIKNPSKYVGKKQPTYRSSWEWTFMQFCDNNPNIKAWASEPMQIPYFNPFKNKQTVYVPDFFIQYEDKNGNLKTELIEIKPSKETSLTKAGKNTRNQAMAVLNQMKWEAADKWCKSKGIDFRILTENELFHNGGKKR